MIIGMGITPHPSSLNYHKIKTFGDLQYAVLRVSHDDWEVFCRGLNTDDATFNDLKHWTLNTKKLELCLQNYFEHGTATWEGVVIAVASSPLNLIVTAKRIAMRYGIDYYAAVGQENLKTSPTPTNHQKIKKLSELEYAVLRVSVEDWEALCKVLNVDKETLADLRRWANNDGVKKQFCLEDYLKYGTATWEGVIKAVASSPLNLIATAKRITNQHGIDYYAVVGQENPTMLYTAPPNHKNIKRFNDIEYAVLRVSVEDWEALCTLLNVDKETLADLRRWTNTDSDKKKFCLEDYLKYGRATWEGVIKAVASDPLNLIVTAKRIANQYGIDYYAAVGQENPTMLYTAPPNHQKIKRFNDIEYAVLRVSIEDWEALCTLLNVDKETLADLRHWTNTDSDKKKFCLEDYLKYGKATWEGVIKAVASDPLNLIVTAKRIANQYGIDYYAAVGQSNPKLSHPPQPSHHKIKKIDELQYAMLNIPHEDWEDICRLLKVDEETVTDLKRWARESDKWKFCLQDYFLYGIATWEDLIHAVASSPLNRIVTAKVIASKHGISFYEAMGMDLPMRSSQPNEHRIRKVDDLKYALLKIPREDWEVVCKQLNVDEPTVTDLKRWSENNSKKWEFCLQDYFDTGVATWEHVVYAVASEPLNEVVLAKKIAQDYAVSYKAVMEQKEIKDEL